MSHVNPNLSSDVLSQQKKNDEEPKTWKIGLWDNDMCDFTTRLE